MNKILWVVIPCYNEEKRLNIGEFVTSIKNNKLLRFCFVNDGSTDKTLDILHKMQKLEPEAIFVISNRINQGKSQSVHNGIQYGLEKFPDSYYGYWDADLSTPLFETKPMYQILDSNPTTQIVLGSRVCILGKKIVRKKSRHYIGRIFATIASQFILNELIYDTQCGAKIFTYDFAINAFKEDAKTNWCFDIELLLNYRNSKNNHRILSDIAIEYPLSQWLDVDGSKVKLIHIFGIIKDLFILYRLK